MLTLDITQVQEVDSMTGIFRFPLAIECITKEGSVKRIVSVHERQTRVQIPLPESPENVIVNKGRNLLASITWKKTQDELVYQLRHAADAVDRLEAAEQLKEHTGSDDVIEALCGSALRDPFWAVRHEALTSLGKSMDDTVRQTLVSATADKHSTVRSAAISGLKRFRGEGLAELIERLAGSDSSYLVLSACIRTLAVLDTTRGLHLAMNSMSVDSYRDIVRRAAITALASIKKVASLPVAIDHARVGLPVDIRMTAMRLLGDVGKSDPNARGMIVRGLHDDVPDLRRTAVRVLSSWNDSAARTALEERQRAEGDSSILELLEKVLEEMD
jgi:aminopeptidase N